MLCSSQQRDGHKEHSSENSGSIDSDADSTLSEEIPIPPDTWKKYLKAYILVKPLELMGKVCIIRNSLAFIVES